MNYLEIAAAYDKQADMLMSTINPLELEPKKVLSTALELYAAALELREKAQACRAAHRDGERLEKEHKMRMSYDEFERSLRTQWLAAEKNKAAAFERIAEVLKAKFLRG